MKTELEAQVATSAGARKPYVRPEMERIDIAHQLLAASGGPVHVTLYFPFSDYYFTTLSAGSCSDYPRFGNPGGYPCEPQVVAPSPRGDGAYVCSASLQRATCDALDAGILNFWPAEISKFRSDALIYQQGLLSFKTFSEMYCDSSFDYEAEVARIDSFIAGLEAVGPSVVFAGASWNAEDFMANAVFDSCSDGSFTGTYRGQSFEGTIAAGPKVPVP